MPIFFPFKTYVTVVVQFDQSVDCGSERDLTAASQHRQPMRGAMNRTSVSQMNVREIGTYCACGFLHRVSGSQRVRNVPDKRNFRMSGDSYDLGCDLTAREVPMRLQTDSYLRR